MTCCLANEIEGSKSALHFVLRSADNLKTGGGGGGESVCSCVGRLVVCMLWCVRERVQSEHSSVGHTTWKKL